MRCEEIQERASRFLDSDLGTEEQGALFRHLEDCLECRSFLESMIRLRKGVLAEREALLREADEILPAAETILRRARRAGSGRRRISIWRRALGGGFRVPVPVAVGIGLVLLAMGIVLGARFPAGTERTVSSADGIEPAPRPAVVVVCGLPEVEVVGHVPRR